MILISIIINLYLVHNITIIRNTLYDISMRMCLYSFCTYNFYACFLEYQFVNAKRMSNLQSHC